MQTPSPLDYSNYRTYLSDYLVWKRSSSKAFTVRSFCLKAGVSTENYLLRVIRKKRNLGRQMAERFSLALSLKGKEADYFLALVEAEHSRTLSSKQHALDRIEKIKRGSRRISYKTDNSMIRHWYVAAIWELAWCKGFELTPQSAVAALRKKISIQQAKETIEFLAERGSLKNEDGKWAPVATYFASTDGIADPMVKLNHRETLQAAMDAVELPIDERGFYGLTMAFSQKRMPEVKVRMKKFIEELQAEFALDAEPDTVYRIGAHCFPLTSYESARLFLVRT